MGPWSRRLKEKGASGHHDRYRQRSPIPADKSRSPAETPFALDKREVSPPSLPPANTSYSRDTGGAHRDGVLGGETHRFGESPEILLDPVHHGQGVLQAGPRRHHRGEHAALLLQPQLRMPVKRLLSTQGKSAPWPKGQVKCPSLARGGEGKNKHVPRTAARWRLSPCPSRSDQTRPGSNPTPAPARLAPGPPAGPAVAPPPAPLAWPG
jgi:hypothetical protein